MPLPAAAQQQRERLQAQESETPEQRAERERLEAERIAAESSNDDPPAPNTNTNTSTDTKVTISKTEFNELQAAKDKVVAAERRADAMRSDLEALQSRLTELEQAAKGTGNGVAAPAPAQAATPVLDTTQIELTEQEKKDFEPDTIALMEKLATNVFRKLVGPLLDNLGQVRAKLDDVETISKNAVTTVGRVSTNSFTDKVKAKVAEFGGDFDKIVVHPHWQDFLQAQEEISGNSYGELLTQHVGKQKPEGVGSVTKIFKLFYDKYVKDAPNSDGYAGSVPSGSSNVDTNAGGNAPKTLKYSDRKKLHEDYIARRISYDDYQTKKAEFDTADREGRVDYTR